VNVAFVGLGKMGAGMASRLLDAGHHLSVYNRTAAKGDWIVHRGARLASSAKDACLNADAVFCMVSHDAASRAMWLGAEGILASGLAPGALAIECSTLSHDWVTELAAQVIGRGLRYIDAPVTGLPPDAAAGSLTLLIGAEQHDLECARGLLGAGFRKGPSNYLLALSPDFAAAAGSTRDDEFHFNRGDGDGPIHL